MAVFNEKELEIIGQYNMPGIYGAPDSIVPKHNYPITPKENMLRMLRGEPVGKTQLIGYRFVEGGSVL